ncbi:MAG: xylose isomerase [Trueperaceae bacterium]|nr:xylose isomerase [Trueperaceae bacterium]
MLLGCCAPIEKAHTVQTAGFNYIEPKVTSLIPDENDSVYEPIYQRFINSPIRTRAFNVFLPKDLKIVGNTIDQERLTTYVCRAVSRLDSLGARIAVIGSAGARNVPEGFSHERALDQLTSFFQLVGDTAEGTGVTIVIEPLNKGESNIINTVVEGVELAKQVNRLTVRVLADFYHMQVEEEPIKSLRDLGDWLGHVHVADTGRVAPGLGNWPLSDFYTELKLAEYTGMISVECNWQNFDEEAASCWKFLHKNFGLS